MRPASAQAPRSPHKSAASRVNVNPLSARTCGELQLDVPVWGKRRDVLRQNDSTASAAALRRRSGPASRKIPSRMPPCVLACMSPKHERVPSSHADFRLGRSMFWLVGQGLAPAREPRFSATSALRLALRVGPSLFAAQVTQRCLAHGLRVRTCRNASHSWRRCLSLQATCSRLNRSQCDRRHKRGPQSRSLPGVQQLTCSAASLPYSMTQNSPAYLPLSLVFFEIGGMSAFA